MCLLMLIKLLFPELKKLLVLGYYAADYSGDMRSFGSLDGNYAWIDSIATFNYLIDDRGNLIGQTYSEAVGLAKSRNIKPLILVHNYKDRFSPELAHQVLTILIIKALTRECQLCGGSVYFVPMRQK